MATINNTALTNELIQGARIQTVYDAVPNQLAEKVVPVMEVNPKFFRKTVIFGQSSSAASGTDTIYTVPAGNKKYYMTGFQLSFAKNAACDIATGFIDLLGTLAETGGTAYFARLPVITLTAERQTIVVQLKDPVQLTSVVNMTGTFAAGILVRSAEIYGFIEENPLA